MDGADATGLALIHGAGLGAWIWREVEPELKCPVLALDFPGRDNSPAGEGLSLEDYSRHVADRIEAWGPRVVIVAHSIGGVVALKVAARLGPRVTGLIGVGAIFPPGGGSFLSCLPFPRRAMLAAMMRLAGTKPPASAIRKSYAGDLGEDVAEEVVSRFVPESPRLYTDPCDAPIPETRTLYIKMDQDKEFPERLQEVMAGNLHARTLGIGSGHLPMLEHPKELAAALNAFML